MSKTLCSPPRRSRPHRRRRLVVRHGCHAPVRALLVSAPARQRYEIERTWMSVRGTAVVADLDVAERVAERINRVRDSARFPHLGVTPGDLYAGALLHELMHLAIAIYRERVDASVFARAEKALRETLGEDALTATLRAFVVAFPPAEVASGASSVDAYLAGEVDGEPARQVALEELLLLYVANENPALERMRELFDDAELARGSAYRELVGALDDFLEDEPGLTGGGSLLAFLLAPSRQHPTSLEAQLGYVRDVWAPALGERFRGAVRRLLLGLDVLNEEKDRGGPGGPAPSVMLDRSALRGRGREEYEAFSSDASWMPRVVLLAKSTYVWLDQLSRSYGRDIRRLDQIPDEELDRIADQGVTGLWLIGLWERSEASRRIKHLRGNPDAVASAYALYDYRIADDLGGSGAYESLRDRAWQRGVRLASDMVPNHVGIDGRWVIEHPEWFVQVDHAPYPGYTFHGPDLSSDERVGIFLEDHYYDNSDAAVVFKRVDRHTGDERFIYHGNDGTSMPWNDTAQVNYLNAEAREAVIQTILHVARQFPIIRFDAAMTLAKQHVQRLWFPPPGEGGAIPSRSRYGSMTEAEFDAAMPKEFWREVVDRVAEEVPDTLLLAEAFWMMEGYFVRTLGMHRVYNSAFMNMLKREENAEYRQLMKNVLEFDPQILGRFVNFMNNPDEETAVAQFGKEDKYFGVATLLATLPGLPMIGHGQVEGYHEKYGMEYRRAKYDEQPDAWLVGRHEREIFPLLHRRWQFADVDGFRLYDAWADWGVNENVYAYSNRVGGAVSLVVVNNSYEQATVTLHRTVGFVDKGAGDGLVQRSLAEGLDLEGGPDRFVALHDLVGGRSRLHRSDDIEAHGLRLELDGYGRRVFLDIEEMVDVDGSWAALHAALAGRAVEDLETARLELRLEPVFAAFERVVAGTSEDDVQEVATSLHADVDADPRARAYAAFLAALDLHTALDVGAASDAAELTDEAAGSEGVSSPDEAPSRTPATSADAPRAAVEAAPLADAVSEAPDEPVPPDERVEAFLRIVDRIAGAAGAGDARTAVGPAAGSSAEPSSDAADEAASDVADEGTSDVADSSVRDASAGRDAAAASLPLEAQRAVAALIPLADLAAPDVLMRELRLATPLRRVLATRRERGPRESGPGSMRVPHDELAEAVTVALERIRIATNPTEPSDDATADLPSESPSESPSAPATASTTRPRTDRTSTPSDARHAADALAAALLADIDEDETACAFLRVNEHGGTRWFNKERFERFAYVVSELATGPVGSFLGLDEASEAVDAALLSRALQRRSEGSGYDVKRLARPLDAPTEEPPEA